ncbi:MAG TPA: haloacid dehalogenase type II [Gammaproteobacteria bacterium]|jgi:2-haloacid dehalogenase|nr:haloacid dehalogenase type II [Gammaproteobacteria bacterium]HAY46845.1 haloacid dehalogenase type II [Gammaproteobacteria bacterium]
MSKTIAFDVYGTLIDTHWVVSALQEIMGDQAKYFSQTWRDKQLEYSFRRGLMQNYETFAVCTSNALDYTCIFYEVDLTQEQKNKLLKSYQSLPAFKDVEGGLSKLQANNYRLFAFSNGTANAVETLLVKAQIRNYFLGVVSVDDLKSFKPNPAVYHHFLRESGAKGSDAWLVSSNPFDVIGAISTGMRAAWVKRSTNAIFDPWGIEPTITVYNLGELYEKIR